MNWKDIIFTENDIKDKDKLELDIMMESKMIFESPVAARGRTLEQILEHSRQGKIAEQFLIETGEYIRCTKKYHDLVDSEANIVEVKAFSVNDRHAPGVKKVINDIKNGDWNHSKYIILFKYCDGIYSYLDTIPIIRTKTSPREFVNSISLPEIITPLTVIKTISDYINSEYINI
jgi:hypothetical protein